MWGTVCLLIASCSSPMPPLPTTPPADRPRLRVALTVPLSGELATYGEVVRNAAELAFDEWNKRQSDSGVFIQVVPQDTPCDAAGAQQVAERIVASGILFIVGGICSEAAIPVARVANDSGALFIATSATHPLVTVDAQGNTRRLVFRTAFAYPQQGHAVSRFLLQTLRLDHVLVVNNKLSPFSRDVTTAFYKSFATLGGDALIVTGDPMQQSFSDYLKSAMKPEIQAVYVPDRQSAVAQVQDVLRAQGIEKTIVGSDWWNVQELDLKALEGVYLLAHYSGDVVNPIVREWAARYRAAFAVEPDALAALAYDAATLLIQGIEQSGSTSPEVVAGALSSLDYKGVTGHWRFNAQHNPTKQAFFLRVQAGALQFAGSASVE